MATAPKTAIPASDTASQISALKDTPEFRQAVMDTIRETGIMGRVENIEQQSQVKDDPQYFEKLENRLPRHVVERFLRPENLRPTTEFYWVADVIGGEFNIMLTHTEHDFHGKTGHEQVEEFILAKFTTPPHQIGTDLTPKFKVETTGKFWIGYCDLALHPDVTVTQEDIDNKALRLSKDIKEPKDGRMSLDRAIAVMQKVIRSKTGPRAKVHSNGGFKKFMTAEEYRVWVGIQYKERWSVEDHKKMLAQTTRGFDDSADKTGAALEALAAIK